MHIAILNITSPAKLIGTVQVLLKYEKKLFPCLLNLYFPLKIKKY